MATAHGILDAGVIEGDRAAGWTGVAAMTLATAAGAQVVLRLPFTPVPFTLQVIAVLLTGLVLSPRRAFAAQAAYVGAGLAGVPWLAGMTALGSGSGWLTAGYLAGFVVAAPAIAIARRRVPAVVAALAGVLVIHAAGCGVLAVLLGVSLDRALMLGSLPFLPLDAAKVLAAVAASRVLAPRS